MGTDKQQLPSEHELDTILYDAFDRMTPSPEAEDRMLASLLSAAERSEVADTSATATARVDTTVVAQGATTTVVGMGTTATEGLPADNSTKVSVRPPAQGRPATKVWRFVLPAAACFVLLAGLGAFGISAWHAQTSLTASVANSQNASSESSSELVLDNTDADSANSDAETSAQSSTKADESVSANTYSLIELPSGIQLRIAVDDEGQPLKADADLVGDYLGAATAYNEADELETTCTVHAYPDETHPYAVLYADGSFYLAAENA